MPTRGFLKEKERAGSTPHLIRQLGLPMGEPMSTVSPFNILQQKEVVKEPVTITLKCSDADANWEVVAQREKMIKEYYQKQGVDPKQVPALPGSPLRPTGCWAVKRLVGEWVVRKVNPDLGIRAKDCVRK